MSTQQLFLFPEFDQPVDEALAVFQTRGVRHRKFTDFTTNLAAAALSCRAGATLVGACPGDLGLDEVIQELKTNIDKNSDPSAAAAPQISYLEVAVPSALTSQLLQREFFDRYLAAFHAAAVRYRLRPKYKEAFTASEVPSTGQGSLEFLLRQRSPSFVIVRDVQNFMRPGGPVADAANLWMTVRSMALNAKVPHLLFGTPAGVLDVLKFPGVVESVQAFVLAPYDLRIKRDADDFSQALEDYDANLPWADGAGLKGREKFIDARVAGDLDRLRSWIQRALIRAKAQLSKTLSWQTFMAAAPSQASVVQAADDLLSINAFLGRDQPEKAGSGTRRRRNNGLKPGQRKLGRDPVGNDGRLGRAA